MPSLEAGGMSVQQSNVVVDDLPKCTGHQPGSHSKTTWYFDEFVCSRVLGCQVSWNSPTSFFANAAKVRRSLKLTTFASCVLMRTYVSMQLWMTRRRQRAVTFFFFMLSFYFCTHMYACCEKISTHAATYNISVTRARAPPC